MVKIAYKILEEGAIAPVQAHKADAGIDFHTNEFVVIQPHSVRTVSTGIAMQMIGTPEMMKNWNLEMQMRSRSSTLSKMGILIEGTIDQEYTGEIKIIFTNLTDEIVRIPPHTKLAQGITSFIPKIDEIYEVEEFEKTERGSKGFGSSDLTLNG